MAPMLALLLIAAAPPPVQPIAVHRCQLNANVPAQSEGLLRAWKTFSLDGTPLGMQVQWDYRHPAFVRPLEAGGDATASIQWPGNYGFRTSEQPFDWSRAAIRLDYNGPSTQARYSPLPGEEWRQIIVDRNRSVLVNDDGSMRTLILSGLDMHLMGELEYLAAPGALTGSLDTLVAWGTGARSITVYETMVTRRAPQRNTYPNDPIGQRRIISTYDLDIVALAGAVAQARAVVERWEQGLATTWSQCERDTENNQIVIPDERIRRPSR